MATPLPTLNVIFTKREKKKFIDADREKKLPKMKKIFFLRSEPLDSNIQLQYFYEIICDRGKYFLNNATKMGKCFN